MIIIIPLGGSGQRFKQYGYKKPKGLVNVAGKPILYYLLECLNLTNIYFVSIPYNKEYVQYNFEDQLKKDFPNINFKFNIVNDTEGAAETLNKALLTFECDDKPILCLDGDNFYTLDIVDLWNGKNKIITFEDLNNDPIYSYIKVNENNITDIVEKDKISNYACTGAYGFESYKQLLHYTNKILDKKIKQKNEYYTSTVIKEMIKDNFNFEYYVINKDNYHCIGTPFQLKLFYNNYRKIHDLSKKKLRFCFDLDNTLVSFPKTKDDYTTVEPIVKNIKLLRYLKSLNHTIIIHTARRMKTHNGNIGKILHDIGKITFDTLDKFSIPYDEIYFGKPNADVYIDDLALNCFDDMEKELGFFMDTIAPRDFNTLENNSINIITKKSKDLSGEIYYYKNIPINLKYLFPLFIDYAQDSSWFKIEKISGLTLSNLYLSELLQEHTLTEVMDSIQKIHTTEFIDNTNIYENYSKKLKERFENYDYSKFHNSKALFDTLLSKLTIYENENKGKRGIIHGDPVFSNIIINNYIKIKFIDMRGKLGKTLTICGDKMYDWAKLYQSLIGYDCILLGKTVHESYKLNLLNVFKKYFLSIYSIEDFENIKLITNSLLFTLIPLHNNEKCFDYYNLINTF